VSVARFLCFKGTDSCECRRICVSHRKHFEKEIFGQGRTMSVPPDSCITKGTLKRKTVLRPDLCQYRPIRECQGRLFRKETCLETKIMLKTGPF